MTARGLCLVLFLGHGISTAQAQFPIAPYVAGALGVSDVRTRIPVQTSPPTVTSFAEHNGNVLGTITVGITFGHHFAADAALRSSLEIGQPFRVLTLGPAVRWGQRVQVHLRGGLGRVQGFQGLSCVAGSSSCARYSTEWATGFDLSAAVQFPSGTSWSIGPMVWWAQSAKGTTQYRSIGLGAQARYR